MVNKIRFIEPGNYSPFKKSIANLLTYNKFIRNPSTGLITLTTIAKKLVNDTLMYSESISEINFNDVYNADIVFIGINTFNAVRGYKIAAEIKQKSKAIVVIGGLHASLNYSEAVEYADYILTGDGDESVVDIINAVSNGEQPNFSGIIYKRDGQIFNTGAREQPQNIDTVPDRNLVYDYSRLAKKLDTLWVQVHASRGCPHNCDYCTVVRHFGRTIRKRTPQNIVADIKTAIEFHKRKLFPRLNTVVWVTDDNFAEDRMWAISVLNEIIKSGIKTNLSVQARFETGFDDELLDLMKQAGFFELALGIEFLDDNSFKEFHKKSNYNDILRSVKNIQKHGLEARGLFIVGAENDAKGVGDTIANYVIDNGLDGGLIQSMFFVPGTPVYDTNKDNLIHTNWEKYCGNVVHYPKNIKPHELQEEIIKASAKIYSVKRLIHALFRYSRFINKVLFIGEFFWQASMRADLKKELPYLKSKESIWNEKIRY
ncbi:B12-binding domain-containing radical SAM protein [Spirochaetia bacterium]|nr:B12-binding domain-containing radical SAM protein [Spirochaetia bacterium]